MTNDLVKFPDDGGGWERVSGPGMYVLAVMPRLPEPDACAVGAAITLLRPHGRLLTPAPPMWPTDESRAYDAGLLEEAAKLFEERGERAKAAVMRAQFPIMDLSVEFSHVTHMGSIERTLVDQETREYWQADWKDLTPAGILLLHQVHTCFVRPPVLLTFLGEPE
jgi:hypothetical protein